MIGQAFERTSHPGSLYVVLDVQKKWGPAFRRPVNHFVLLCVVPPEGWTMMHPGRQFTEVTDYLQTVGYTQLA